MPSLKKTAIVTGVSKFRSIGSAIAQKLALSGYELIIHALDETDEFREINKYLTHLGNKVYPIVGDLTKFDSISAVVDCVNHNWDQLDVLVCSAASTKHTQTFEDISPINFMEVYNINVISVFNLIRALVPAFLRASQPSITTISSLASLSGKGSSVTYTVSKGALNSLTLWFANQLAPQVRVNAICPSFVNSSWWDDFAIHRPNEYNSMCQQAKENSALNKLIESDNVADLVMMIIANPVITGEIFRLDAGQHLGRLNSSIITKNQTNG